MLNKMKVSFLLGLGGLAVMSFVVMMGYTIGSQSVTHHMQKQIQTEAHKLLTQEKEVSSQMSWSKNFSPNTTLRESWGRTTTVLSSI